MSSPLKTLTINGKTFTITPVVPTSTVTLLASAWEGDGEKYSQVVEIPGVTSHTKVDLQLTSDQAVAFHPKVLGFVAENDGGVVEVFAIGCKPVNDHTLQATLTEVEATGKIRGNFVSTTMPRSNLGQTDPTRADYVEGREEFLKQVGNGSGQNVTLDATLTQSGKAADAKATGDEIKRVEGKIPSIEGLAKTEDVPKVPNWAMQTSKPAYTASEVGALPNTYTPPNQTAEQVGADPKGTAASAVSAHNTNANAHNDIRQELSAINARLTAFFDSDNQTLDELSEIVAYITSNKSLIDAITTSKVSVADIINNLTTNVANKPLSAAQGVVIKGLIDGLSSGKLDASKLTEAINTALAQAKATGAFDGADGATPHIGANGNWYLGTTDTGVKAQGRDGDPGDDGYTPARGKDYWTPVDIASMEAKLAQMLAERAQLRPEPAESLAWLEANGDTNKLYVLMDKTSAHYGYIYGYFMTEVESGPAYTNVLPLAINADKTPYVGNNGEKGYKTGYRLNSSRAEREAADRCCTGFIPVKNTDVVRWKNIKKPIDNNLNGYVHFYASDFTTATGMMGESPNWGDAEYVFTPAQLTNAPGYVSGTNAIDSTAYMRISTGIIDDTSIITINEEIVEGGGTTQEYAWANTGIAFVSTDYGPRVTALEKQTNQNATDIVNLKNGVTSATPIKDWDAPIYDANIPVFQLSVEKAAMTNAAQTPADIYARYDALMAKHPHYITKTDLGLCSDGVNHVYRYDFREPDSRHSSGYPWSETKAKAIIVSGIHYEWSGIYGLYYALEEIAENPDLYALRRNTHLIVVPCMNPYATIANNYQSGLPTPNSQGVRNANGVEIHRNFEVGWVLTEEGTPHYGGPEPLSEVETRYVDTIMRENADAALFLTCHSFGDKNFNFIWPSTATAYMCNMGYRLIDKLSHVWVDKYADELVGLEEYRTDDIPAWDNRLGFAHISQTPGTETRQGTKYNIQSANVEINGRFWVHGTEASPEPSMSAFTMSRGAEVYINFLLTVFGVYDSKDKKAYAPAAV